MAIKVDVKTFSKAAMNATVQSWAAGIAKSVQETPEFRKEIARTFQVANRRIQNIEKAGVISPALAALGERAAYEGYSKFKIGDFGHSDSEWQKLKIEYGKAIAFLQQPTSTVTGSRDFEKHVKDSLFNGAQIDDKGKEIFWDAIKEDVLTGFNDVSPAMLGAMRYKDIMQEIYDKTTDDTASLIERLAIQFADNLQDDINEQSYRIAVEAWNTIDEFIESLFDGFGKL